MEELELKSLPVHAEANIQVNENLSNLTASISMVPKLNTTFKIFPSQHSSPYITRTISLTIGLMDQESQRTPKSLQDQDFKVTFQKTKSSN